ncbi:MAG: outer membrane protein assembly factor BamD [Actinomycetota bacterium]|nr:outer membrane protein assembly factor BamD [Actinomycetota bacterium]
MYTYRRRHRPDAGSILFIVVFVLIIIGISFLSYFDKGKFWDILPFISIPSIVISLIFIIINFIRRTKGNIFFVLFFILSVSGLILSNFFGPSALYFSAEKNFSDKAYEQSINYYKMIQENYPGSRFADNAIKNIPDAYFLNHDYREAVKSYKEAIDLNILSGSDLEPKKILEECYINLAEEYYNSGEFGLSAENYLNAAEVLQEIKNDFPDTNEAFIAMYKIPEYLYQSALCFNKTEDWDKSLESLEEIVENYEDDKYFYEASLLLANTHINKAIDFVEGDNYQEGIEEFLKILDLETLDYDYDNINDYKKSRVFSDIPAGLLETAAKNKYIAGSYKRAIFLCELIIDYYPQMDEDVISILVNSKIKVTASSNYNSLEQSAAELTFWGPEKSILMIEDNTEFDLTIYLKGPVYKIIRVEKNSSAEIEITAGTYEAVAELNNQDILPYYGELTYEEGKKYREEYKIAE